MTAEEFATLQEAPASRIPDWVTGWEPAPFDPVVYAKWRAEHYEVDWAELETRRVPHPSANIDPLLTPASRIAKEGNP